MVFLVVMYGCESWTIKKAECQRINVFEEKTLESPLNCKEIKPVSLKGSQPWVFIGRSDAEAETPKLWPPDAKSQLIGKDSAAGKDWGQEEKETTEDEMTGWYHQLNGHEFEQNIGGWEGIIKVPFRTPFYAFLACNKFCPFPSSNPTCKVHFKTTQIEPPNNISAFSKFTCVEKMLRLSRY